MHNPSQRDRGDLLANSHPDCVESAYLANMDTLEGNQGSHHTKAEEQQRTAPEVSPSRLFILHVVPLSPLAETRCYLVHTLNQAIAHTIWRELVAVA